MRNSISKVRLPWFVVALALMLISAYSIIRCISSVGAISGWTGLPEYATALREVQRYVIWWGGSALVSPFLAAVALLLSYTAPARDEPQTWFSPVQRYLVQLALAVVGVVILTLLLILAGFVSSK
jgi:hypothetical protein